jgi:hypothetical protein
VTNLTHFFVHWFIFFISPLYMFPASQCSSSGDRIVLIHHLVWLVCVSDCLVGRSTGLPSSASSWSLTKDHISDLFVNPGSSVTRYIFRRRCLRVVVSAAVVIIFCLFLFHSIYLVILFRVVSIVKCDRCQSKTWVWSRLVLGIAGSNPAEGTDVRVFCLLCVV